jgi:hypothetical protein
MTSHKDDPRWQAAYATYLMDKAPGETAARALLRRIKANIEMFERELALADDPQNTPAKAPGQASTSAQAGGRSHGPP